MTISYEEQINIIADHVVIPSGNDTMLTGDLLEIALTTTQIINVDRKLWDSWSGRRFKNGEEYHGPVYLMNDLGIKKLYTGARRCGCAICTSHVDSSLKPN